MMLPAALSLLTTTFRDGQDRNTRAGRLGRCCRARLRRRSPARRPAHRRAGMALGAVREPPICVLRWRRRSGSSRATCGARFAGFDLIGSVLVTGGMLLLVFALMKAPDRDGVRYGRSLSSRARPGCCWLPRQRAARPDPLVPLSIFRVSGLAAADVTQLVAVAGVVAMFFFLTLYMQPVLGYSPMKTGLAYLPLCAGVAVAAGVASQLIRADRHQAAHRRRRR